MLYIRKSITNVWKKADLEKFVYIFITQGSVILKNALVKKWYASSLQDLWKR